MEQAEAPDGKGRLHYDFALLYVAQRVPYLPVQHHGRQWAEMEEYPARQALFPRGIPSDVCPRQTGRRGAP